MKYKTYIFDLYGTLVDIHTDEEKPEIWEKMAMFYGYYRALYRPKELHERFLALVNSGESEMKAQQADSHEAFPELRIEDVFGKLFAEKGVEADRALAVHAGQFLRILSTEYVRVYDGVHGMLSALKAAGKKIYLLSNAQRIFTEYEMHVLDIAKYFDDIFISSDYGIRKPDERFFGELLEKHRIDPAESVMIGNDMESDIAGAKKVGLHTFYIHSNISPELKGTPTADDVLMRMDMEEVRRRLLEEDLME